MSRRKPNLSRGQKEKSMLDVLLEEWDLDYKRFSEVLGIEYPSLWRYRQGQRELKLTWEQIQKLEKLLEQVGKKFSDLPPDWIRDK